MNETQTDDLRREIGLLGAMLGDTIRECAGERAFQIVEDIRHAAWGRRTGHQSADEQIKRLVADLDYDQMRMVIRAFTIFLDLLNVTEDRRRVQVLGQRRRDAYPQPPAESIRDAITRLKQAGKSADQIQSLVDHLKIDLVFTAHPTEAKRRSVRSKLRVIRQWMQQIDSDPSPEQRDRIERAIRAEIIKLWQTDFIRPWRPSVMQEVGRGLSIKPVLWNEVPRIAAELAQALRENYGDDVAPRRSCVVFGSWIGGDRDGHPGVTFDVTDETLTWLRSEAIAFHLKTCDVMHDSLSMSNRQVQIGASLEEAIGAAVERWPELEKRLEVLSPGELCRRWLAVIRWRLENSLAACPQPGKKGGNRSIADHLSTEAAASVYQSACELSGDVAVLERAVTDLPGSQYVAKDLAAWQTQIETFGLHLARLDVRQNAKVYFEVANEILQHIGLCDDPASLDEAERCRLLSESLAGDLKVDLAAVSPMVKETLNLFGVLHRVTQEYSMAAVGAHVISMTSAPSDALTVLWLWQRTRPASGESTTTCLPIAPLLETIEDLANGPDILQGMLSIPAYREYLRRQGDQQMIMLGYSDSTKDGGYLSACWSLHHSQQALVKVAKQEGVELTFFHGRGGSLGRGGGPAARSILSLPRGTFHGRLRLTEQGEVLADRYDDPTIAHRHLEQVVWSSLLAAGNPEESDDQQWYSMMEDIAQRSFVAYRELLERPGFVEYFRSATPISDIEQLPIGSRPSRRKPDGGLADLRAIPWVFSWTQSRCLLPAWYGIGAAMGSSVDDNAQLQELQNMYRQWPFFTALVDNTELALAKSDLEIASEYAGLAGSDERLQGFATMIANEYRESCRVILALTGRAELLDGTPWLKESIRVRNRFIDPLNLIQVELLRRAKQAESSEDAEELRHLTRLSINGVAAGMRTSG